MERAFTTKESPGEFASALHWRHPYSEQRAATDAAKLLYEREQTRLQQRHLATRKQRSRP